MAVIKFIFATLQLTIYTYCLSALYNTPEAANK